MLYITYKTYMLNGKINGGRGNGRMEDNATELQGGIRYNIDSGAKPLKPICDKKRAAI